MKTFALTLCLLGLPMLAGAATGKCSDVPVAFTIYSTYADPATGVQYTSAIQPDGGGEYINGVDNVVALIHVCNGSNAVTVNANGGPRTLTYNLQNAVNPTLAPSWTSSPVTTSSTFVSFSNILYAPATTVTSFTTYMNELYLPNEPNGPFYVSMENMAAQAPTSKITSDATPCANSLVNVVHYPATTNPSAPEHWVVWADSQPQSCNGGVFQQIASMVSHSKGHTLDNGEYTMPFYMIIRRLP
jgi:hypothetical protein